MPEIRTAIRGGHASNCGFRLAAATMDAMPVCQWGADRFLRHGRSGSGRREALAPRKQFMHHLAPRLVLRTGILLFLVPLAVDGIGLPSGPPAVQEPSAAAASAKPLSGSDPELLWNASRTGDWIAVRAALEAGVPVDSKTPYGSTALCFACDRGHLEVARLLLEYGADPAVRDTFYSASPLDWARSGGHFPLISLLLEKGAPGADGLLLAATGSGDAALAEAVLASRRAEAKTVAVASRIAAAEKDGELTALFEGQTVDPLPEYLPTPEQLVVFAGLYTDGGNLRLVLAVEGEKLMLDAGEADPVGLVPLVENEFWGDGSRLVFSVSDGKVTGLKQHREGQELELLPAPPDGGETPPSTGAAADGKPAEKPAEEKTAEEEPDLPEAEPHVASASDLAVSSANWPGFRGTGSRGVAEGQHPPVVWDATTGENLLWKTAIPGLGFSCPSIWGDRLYVTSAASATGDRDVRIGLYGDVDSVADDSVYGFLVFCLDKRTGEIVWQRTAHTGRPAVKRHSKSSHANPTVATNGDLVVAFFGTEGLYCYDRDGRLVWKKDLGLLDSGWFLDPGYQWGFGSSPLIFEDRVIVQCDIQKNSFVAALDLKTGDELWRTAREEIPTWPSPVVHRFGDLPMLITHGTRAARGYDVRDGKQLWSLASHSEIVVPTPVVAHDLIFLASGYSPIQPIVAVRPTARGELELPGRSREDGSKAPESDPHIAWSKPRGGPYMPTPVAYGPYLYVCSNSGILTCYRADSGDQVYRERLKGGGTMAFTASPIASDGHLYLTAEDGRVFVVAAGGKFRQLGENPMGASALSTPAISDGIFFGRTVDGLVAFQNPPPDETGSAPALPVLPDSENPESGVAGPAAVPENRLSAGQKARLVEAFSATHDGFSSDEVILSDSLQEKFLAACAVTVPELSAEACNWGLINLRKAGGLAGIPTTRRPPTAEADLFPLAEIVTRQLQDRHSVSIDGIMALPTLRSEFDQSVRAMDPQADPYGVRRAAFALRKTRRLKPELITRIADWGREVTVQSADAWRADPARIPASPGIYIFSDPSGYLYIGESDNLRRRIESHLGGSDRKSLADYLAGQGYGSISVELHTFAEGSRMGELQVRRAYESELIRSRNPRFNIQP